MGKMEKVLDWHQAWGEVAFSFLVVLCICGIQSAHYTSGDVVG